MFHRKLPIVLLLLLVLFFGCSLQNADEERVDRELTEELSLVMDLYMDALKDASKVESFRTHIEGLDARYGSRLQETMVIESPASSRVSGGGSYPPLTDLPITRDGDIYLSGGVSDFISSVVNWVCPTSTSGEYHHGAILDLDKFDPSNPDSACFQSAVPEGAGYETPLDWQTKPNVAVMKPKYAINASSLNSQQRVMDLYCNGTYSTSYGFFKDMANIFSIVSKGDNYYWYCTKVVWRVYNGMGYQNIDSNTSAIDWTSSGLYNFVKSYYSTIYFWSPSRARSKTSSYIANAKSTLVLAEEIYYSPYLTKYYEKIRY